MHFIQAHSKFQDEIQALVYVTKRLSDSLKQKIKELADCKKELQKYKSTDIDPEIQIIDPDVNQNFTRKNSVSSRISGTQTHPSPETVKHHSKELAELLTHKSSQLDQAIRSTLNDLNTANLKNSKLVIENSILNNNNSRLMNENIDLKNQVGELSKSLQLSKEIITKQHGLETIFNMRTNQVSPVQNTGFGQIISNPPTSNPISLTTPNLPINTSIQPPVVQIPVSSVQSALPATSLASTIGTNIASSIAANTTLNQPKTKLQLDPESEDEDSSQPPTSKLPKLDPMSTSSANLAQFIAQAQKNLQTNGLAGINQNGVGNSNGSSYTYQVTTNPRLGNSKSIPPTGNSLVINGHASTLGGSLKTNNQILCQYRTFLKK